MVVYLVNEQRIINNNITIFSKIYAGVLLFDQITVSEVFCLSDLSTRCPFDCATCSCFYQTLVTGSPGQN